MRIIVFVLLAIIVGMLVAWRPWQANISDERVVTVTGQAKVMAEPDEYAFYPNYQFKNADKDTALAELTKKSEEVVQKLKELGVADNKIKTNSDGHNYNYYKDRDNTSNYTLNLTITVDNKELAQSVQDYLVTTEPLGQVSAQGTFSDARRKELESQARDEATKDARDKADQSAQNLGFKIAKVKSVQDGAGFGDVIPFAARGTMSLDAAASTSPESSYMAIQPGENEINYTVTVTYFVR